MWCFFVREESNASHVVDYDGEENLGHGTDLQCLARGNVKEGNLQFGRRGSVRV